MAVGLIYPPAQNSDLLPKYEDFCFQRRWRPKQIDDQAKYQLMKFTVRHSVTQFSTPRQPVGQQGGRRAGRALSVPIMSLDSGTLVDRRPKLAGKLIDATGDGPAKSTNR